MSFEKKIPSDSTFVEGFDKIANAILANGKNGALHGTITFTGAETSGVLGGDYTDLTEAQLRQKYPFNKCFIEKVQGYQKDKATALKGTDKFLVMPNYYVKLDCGDDGSITIHFSDVKLDSGYSRVYSSDNVSWLHLGTYLSDDDGNYLRSRSGYLPRVNLSQPSALEKMPYFNIGNSPVATNNFRRAEYLDYRIYYAYWYLIFALKKTRDVQSIYRGISDYSGNNGDWSIIPESFRTTGVTDSVSTDFGEVTFYKEGDTDVEAADGKKPCKMFGVENPFGLIWQNCYGLYQKSGRAYGFTGDKEYTNIKPTNDNADLTDLMVDLPQVGGYQKVFADGNNAMLPTQVGGSSSTYLSDHYFYDSGWRIAVLGGHWPDASNGGLALYVHAGFGYSAASFGFRLSYIS